MSYFGTALTELMERKKLTAADLERIAGIDDSMISRFRSGDKVPSPENLGRLLPALSSDINEQARLVRAWALDHVAECSAAGAELVKGELLKNTIAADKQAGRVAPPAHLVKLPDEAEANFAAMREGYIQDPNVRSIVDGVGGVLRTGYLQPSPNSTRPKDPPGFRVKIPAQRFGPKKTPPQK